MHMHFPCAADRVRNGVQVRVVADAAAIRQQFAFKAKRMPDFSRPFAPDPTKVAPVTTAKEPLFATAKRLGSAHASPTKPDLSAYVCTPHGKESAFASSLRR